MKRDDDLMRELLFELEANEEVRNLDYLQTDSSTAEERRRFGHIQLLADAGLVELGGKRFDRVRLTNAGHDMIEAIRDDTIWHRTKDVARNAGGATLNMLGQIAIELLKQRVEATIGVKL